MACTTKPHRDNVVERTPEKLGAQNDKRRLLKKQARKARADNLIRCTKEKGVDGFVRQGKFTDDGQEWNQKLHRHCEGVCILIPMRRGKCSTPLHATFEHLVNTLLRSKTPLASQSPATVSPFRLSIGLARPSSSTQRIMAPMTEAQRCGRSLKRWLVGDGCVLARTQAIRPKCLNLNVFLEAKQNDLSKHQHKPRHCSSRSSPQFWPPVGRRTRQTTTVGASTATTTVSLSHAHQSLGTLSCHLMHSVEPA